MRAAPCPVALAPARRSPHCVAVRMMAAGVMDAVSRVLARRWIDAIVLSAAIQTAATTLVIILGRMLSAGDSASAVFNAIFLSLAAVITAVSPPVFRVHHRHVGRRQLPVLSPRRATALH